MAARFQRVATHVIGSRGAASTTAEHPPDSETTPAAHDEPAGLRVLSPTQLADFARTGYCMFTIPKDELPPSHHADFYDMIYGHAHSENGTGGQMPIAAVADVVDSPSFSGALRSILGPGYMVGCYGNGTPILHAPRAKADDPGAAASVDQNWCVLHGECCVVRCCCARLSSRSQLRTSQA